MAAQPITRESDSVKGCLRCGEAVPNASRSFCSRRCGALFVNEQRGEVSLETLMDRFWAKVDKTPGHGPRGECWHWTGRVDGRGYGEIKIFGRYKKAHRVALYGTSVMQHDLFACHECDNPRCVRPDHLFPGTSMDNVRDMHAKGRAWRQKGVPKPRRC